ncbi:MAG: aldolase/citrate lyase family protein [Flavobacteriales bacterium]
MLENVVNENFNLVQKSSVAVRINNPSTNEFTKDVELLQRLKNVHWETIIIPKVENVEQIKIALEYLKIAQINFKNIAIFIESEKGIESLQDIIAENFTELKYIQFGHADYNLDRKIFPLKHQGDIEYWQWIERIAHDLNNTNIVFINSPCLLLNDDDFFNYNLQKLYSLLKEKCGQMTLNLKQTTICNNFKKSESVALNYTSMHRVGKFDFAKELIASIELNTSDKSFTITANNYLVCPQEVMMAKIFLKA